MNPMDRPRPNPIARALLPGLLLATTLAACGGDDVTPLPPNADQRPATLVALPSATDLPTDTPEPTATLDPAAEATKNAAGLPEGNEVILQFARIEPQTNEPALAAEFRPNFSMRASGHVVFAYRDDYSQDDWYQTVITPSLGEAFVRRLWDDIGIAELAEKLAAPKLDYALQEDGSVSGPEAMGVIYVKSNKGSARLVVPAKDLENPGGPYAERLTQLEHVIRCLEWWRGSVAKPLDDLHRQGCAATLGWWQERREAWGPAALTAFGTLASADMGGRGLAWPVEKRALKDLVKAGYGTKPSQFTLEGEDAAAAWRTELTRNNGDVGTPLWREGDTAYLVGLRPEVPGRNEVAVPYSFKALPTAAPTKAPTATGAAKTATRPAAAATKAGAAGQPTAKATSAPAKATATRKP